MSVPRSRRRPWRALPLLALPLLPGFAFAPTPPAVHEPAAHAGDAQPDGDARALRRVLHLSGGGTLRAVTRFHAGRWEMRGPAGWKALPAGAVQRAVLERELLREAAAMERSSDGSAPARVELAAWKLEQGLRAEAVAELDRVLERHPLCPEAIELLARQRLFDVPALEGGDEAGGEAQGEPDAALARLVSWAVGAPAVKREAALAELSRAEPEPLRHELRAALGSPVVQRRSFAAQAHGRLLPGEELEGLLVRAVLDPSEDVRRHAAIALSAAGEPVVAAPLVRALDSSNPRVRAQAAEALGHLGVKATVAPLMARLASAAQGRGGPGSRVPHSYVFVGRQFAYVQDFDVEVAQFQAVANPQINVLLEGDVLDAGVHSVTQYSFAYESKVIRGALANLTGEHPGYTARAWLDWWARNADEWLDTEAAATTTR